MLGKLSSCVLALVSPSCVGGPQKLGKYEWLALLLQKERDLNTAARIGQSLVKQNSALMEENNKLEAMLGSAREEVFGYLREEQGSVCSLPQTSTCYVPSYSPSSGFCLLP